MKQAARDNVLISHVPFQPNDIMVGDFVKSAVRVKSIKGLMVTSLGEPKVCDLCGVQSPNYGHNFFKAAKSVVGIKHQHVLPANHNRLNLAITHRALRFPIVFISIVTGVIMRIIIAPAFINVSNGGNHRRHLWLIGCNGCLIGNNKERCVTTQPQLPNQGGNMLIGREKHGSTCDMVSEAQLGLLDKRRPWNT
jgi:hypothetical protein